MKMRNNKAVGYWGIATAFLAVLIAMSYVLLRDGAPEGYPESLVMGLFLLFWAGGIGAAGYAYSHPRVEATVEPGTVRVVRRYPLRTRRDVYGPGDLGEARVVETKDSDGDPYFVLRLSTLSGDTIDLAEGHSREECDAALAGLEEALGRRPT